jgi:protein-disulfide isomerase
MTLGDAQELTVPVTASDHLAGSLDAPMSLLEYGDYECPHCGAAHVVVKEIQRRLGPELVFAFRNFPLAGAHPHSVRAAEGAEAAGGQERFWPMHDQLFEHQNMLDDHSILRHAVSAGVADLDRFANDLAEHRYLPRIRADVASGARSGVNGTPTFFINGVRHQGGYDVASLMQGLSATRAHLRRM